MMTRERIVPYGGLVFVVAAALMLGTLIMRSPNTHGHLWRSLPPDYARTPLDSIGEANLQAIVKDLPPFTFPAVNGGNPADKATGSSGMGNVMVGMDGMGSAMSASSMQGMQQVTLVQTEYAITPDRSMLKVGVPVELTVSNEGKQVHGLWLPDFGISEDIRSGKTQVFRFTPDKPGRFRYACSYNLCGTEEEHARMVGFVTIQ